MFPRNLPMNSDYLKKMIRLLLLLALVGCVQRLPAEQQVAPVGARPGAQLLAAGVRSFSSGDYATAMRFFNEALVIDRGVDDGDGMAHAEVNMAETALAMGDVVTAREHLLAAKRLVAREGLTPLAPHLEMIAASLAIREGRGDAALAILAPFLAEDGLVAGGNGRAEFRLAALINRIQLVSVDDQSGFRQWLDRYRQALAVSQPVQGHYQGRLLRFEAQLAHWQGKREERDRFLAQALTVYRQGESRPTIAATLAEWGRYLMEDRQWSAARDRLDRAFFVRVAMQDSYGCEQVLALLGRLDEAVGDRGYLAETQRRQAVIRENQPRFWSRLLQMRNPSPR